MKVLKKFELNNKVLEDFDTLMTYHLDQVEELSIKEISINPKLYNIISLCINVKTLIIEGDLRVDTNKIVYNLCKPEKLENIVLNSVKLPTNKILSRFVNLRTIALTNIKFSDINKFFNQIPSKESVIALKLENVDLNRNSISMCGMFENLQFLNIDNLSNCIFDDFSFLINNINLKRINIQNSIVEFDKINALCRLKCRKTIDILLETSDICEIQNSFEVDEDNISYLTVNITDLEKTVEKVNFYKLNELCIIFDDNINLNSYIKTLKKIKNHVSIAINDILYLDLETAQKLRDKIHVNYINILGKKDEFDIKYTYSIDKYIALREKFNQIQNEVSEEDTEIDKFFAIYEYMKKEYKIVGSTNIDELEDAIIEHNCVYNLVASFLKSILGLIGIESKVIEGKILGNSNKVTWNQVKLNGKWYNLDLALDMSGNANKKTKLGYMIKNYLYPDEQFYKTHTPESGKPELCDEIFGVSIKSDSNKENGIAKKIFNKIKSINKLGRKGENYDSK